MKKMMKLFAAAFVAIVAVSCLQEMRTEAPGSDVKMVDVTFGVSTGDVDAEGKAHVGYDGQTPVMHWTKGDKVAVMDVNTEVIYEFTLCGGEDTSEGMFTGQLPEDVLASETQNWVVVYPFESLEGLNKIEENKNIVEAVLPVQQQAVNNGIAEGVNMLVCAASTLKEGVKMFPVGNFLKVEIQGTGITSLTVFNNDNQLNAGFCRPNISIKDVTGSYLNPTGSSRFSNKVVLVPAEGEETIAPGTYYLVCRMKYDTGMTLKFTNAEGKVAFYSSDQKPDVSDRNKTIDLGSWDAASLNWKKEETVTIDFSSQPFTEDLPTDKNTAIDALYTIGSNLRQVTIFTTEDASNEAYIASSTRGLLFDNADDYIEFPAIPGKKLKEVQVTTAYKSTLTANVTDESGTDMDGESAVKLYAGNVYSHVLPKAEINKKYRYVVESVSTSLVRLQKITLIYAGDDVAEISGVTASAANAFDGFTVKGELLGGGLDAATWGIEYGTSEDALAEVATGNGGVIDHFVEAAAGTYYVRVWASADNGTTKTYSDIFTVTVALFSGTITFDFSSAESVQQSITYVGTTDASDPDTATDITAYRSFASEETGISDYYTYKTSDGVFPFTMLSYIESGATNTTGYQFYGTSGGFRIHACGYKYSVFMSIPKVEGYRLTKTTFWSPVGDGRGHVCTSGIVYDKDQIGSISGSNVEDGGLYKYEMDLSSKSHTADDQCWLIYSKNRWNSKIVFTYEKVN